MYHKHITRVNLELESGVSARSPRVAGSVRAMQNKFPAKFYSSMCVCTKQKMYNIQTSKPPVAAIGTIKHNLIPGLPRIINAVNEYSFLKLPSPRHVATAWLSEAI